MKNKMTMFLYFSQRIIIYFKITISLPKLQKAIRNSSLNLAINYLLNLISYI